MCGLSEITYLSHLGTHVHLVYGQHWHAFGWAQSLQHYVILPHFPCFRPSRGPILGVAKFSRANTGRACILMDGGVVL